MSRAGWICSTRKGGDLGCGLAFTIDPMGQHYAGDLTRKQIVRRLATATGALGSSAEYLFETCKSAQGARHM